MPMYWRWLLLGWVVSTAEGWSAPQTASRAQIGLASWYGAYFQGRLMSDGCRFDRHAMTAASKTLPLGAWVEVRNLRNNSTALVQIRDRGPYVPGRIIDMSETAARAIGFRQDGIALVSVRMLWVDLIHHCN